MFRIKFNIILFIDWFDDVILRHCFHPWLCGKIADSKWWGEDNFKENEDNDE